LIEGPTAREHDSNNKKQTIIIVVSTSLGSILVCLILAVYLARRKKKRSKKTIPASDQNYTNESGKEDTELSSYSMSIIAKSTNNFSVNNKLGEGGFGPVYKVILSIYVGVTLKIS
jgi:Mg2+/citrate symporter